MLPIYTTNILIPIIVFRKDNIDLKDNNSNKLYKYTVSMYNNVS